MVSKSRPIRDLHGTAHCSGSFVRRGAQDVIGLGFRFSAEGWLAQPARMNGDPGIVIRHAGRTFSVIGFTVRRGRIAAIDILADPARLRDLDLSALDE